MDRQSTYTQFYKQLCLAQAVGMESVAVRCQLVCILSEGFNADDGHDCEGLLLAMLLE